MAESTEDRVRRLKKQYEDKSAALERATGTLQAGMKRLKEEFECSSVEAAQKKLAALGTEREKLQTALNETLTDLEEALSGEQ